MNADTTTGNKTLLSFPAPKAATEFTGNSGRISLPEGWLSLATVRRDTRLYRVTRRDGGIHWEAAAVFNEAVEHRRFASELHALAWLSAVDEPHFSQNPFDPEELKERYRTASVLRGGRAMPSP